MNNNNKDKITNIRCFIKKKYVCLFIFSAATEEVEEKEKNKPRKKSIRKLNNIFLSIFLQ